MAKINPQMGDVVWYLDYSDIDDKFYPDATTWANNCYDREMQQHETIYNTEEEAQRVADERNKAIQYIK